MGACSEAVPDRVVEVEPDAIRTFNVQVPEEILDDLDDRLKRARLPDQIPDTDWSSLYSRGRFRSSDLWVMGPARFRCATLLLIGHQLYFIESNT